MAGGKLLSCCSPPFQNAHEPLGMVLQIEQVCQRVSAGTAAFLDLDFLRGIEAGFFLVCCFTTIAFFLVCLRALGGEKGIPKFANDSMSCAGKVK